MKRLNVGFVGLGKLGKIAAETINEYHVVFGYDINPEIEGSFFKANSIEECVKGRDIVLVAVQTPHDERYDGREPTSHLPPKDFDYEHIKNAVADIDKHVDKNTLISVISTMLPGTVRREIAPLVKNGRFIYNPYLIAQGTVQYDMKNPEMIMIGTENGEEDDDVKLLYDLYDPMVPDNTRYEVGTWEEIEAVKVFYNTFISAKLSLVNMIQDVAMNIGHMDAAVVAQALANSKMRIMGPSYMKPGYGDGGGCHPRDNIALRVLNNKFNLGYDLFDSIMKAREEQAANMARYCLKFQKDIVILGSSFKPGLKKQTEGSPSMLVGWYCEKLNSYYKVHYIDKDDKAPDDKPYTYLIHDKDLTPEIFPEGSVIVDPQRKLRPNDEEQGTMNCRVYHYGNSRHGEAGSVVEPELEKLVL